MKRRRNLSPVLRSLCDRQNWRCYYCNRDLVTDGNSKRCPSVDHMTPTSRGGSERLLNKVAACFACNNLKGDRTAPEFRLYVELKGITL